LHPDGKTLYFSSDGHPGFGRLDVFMSRLQKDGSWGVPVNLGQGVNSSGKDNSLMVMPRGGKALFATTRESGNLDFWEFDLPEEAKPIEVAMLKGVVKDFDSGTALIADVSLIDMETGQVISKTKSNGEEGFVIPLPGLGTYSFEASADGHLFGMSVYHQLGGADLNRSPFVEIGLEAIEAGQTFTLDAIQFESGLAALSSDYQAGCERLAQWMLDNPGVNIRVEGHTDNVGSVPFNMALSEDRATSVLNFLIDRGVAASRIVVEGKGPLEPIADNETEEGRAKNRRVQVVVLE
jgi:outer membrane protein OmpA-like peptidoglycan-associated protein